MAHQDVWGYWKKIPGCHGTWNWGCWVHGKELTVPPLSPPLVCSRVILKTWFYCTNLLQLFVSSSSVNQRGMVSLLRCAPVTCPEELSASHVVPAAQWHSCLLSYMGLGGLDMYLDQRAKIKGFWLVWFILCNNWWVLQNHLCTDSRIYVPCTSH